MSAVVILMKALLHSTCYQNIDTMHDLTLIVETEIMNRDVCLLSGLLNVLLCFFETTLQNFSVKLFVMNGNIGLINVLKLVQTSFNLYDHVIFVYK